MLLENCGKPAFSNSVISRLADLGCAIDQGASPLVFDNGFVGLNRPIESEVINDAPSTHTRNGSASRPRQRRFTSSRSRPTGEAEPFGSAAIEAAYGTGFRLLVRHYKAISFEDKKGLWVVIKTRPLGPNGPQAHFLVALPLNKEIWPKAWAFSVANGRREPFPLKHTNFPDASICAFTRESKAWTPDDGILPLADHYCLWAVKSWHRWLLGRWPGRQIGVGAHYRRQEFLPDEWCGCDSGKRYRVCHLAADSLVSNDFAINEFENLFHTPYATRTVPKSILRAADTRWRVLPTLQEMYQPLSPNSRR